MWHDAWSEFSIYTNIEFSAIVINFFLTACDQIVHVEATDKCNWIDFYMFNQMR